MLQIVTKTMREIYPYSDTSLSDPVLQDLISAMTKLLWETWLYAKIRQ